MDDGVAIITPKEDQAELHFSNTSLGKLVDFKGQGFDKKEIAKKDQETTDSSQNRKALLKNLYRMKKIKKIKNLSKMS